MPGSVATGHTGQATDLSSSTSCPGSTSSCSRGEKVPDCHKHSKTTPAIQQISNNYHSMPFRFELCHFGLIASGFRWQLPPANANTTMEKGGWPVARDSAGFAGAGGRMYLFAGFDGQGADPASALGARTHCSSPPRRMSFSNPPPPPAPSSGFPPPPPPAHSLAIPCYSGSLGDLWSFDPVAGNWTLLNPPSVAGAAPSPRISPGFVAAEGRLYVVGGYTVGGTFPSGSGEGGLSAKCIFNARQCMRFLEREACPL
jgi:hypothetical protein